VQVWEKHWLTNKGKVVHIKDINILFLFHDNLSIWYASLKIPRQHVITIHLCGVTSFYVFLLIISFTCVSQNQQTMCPSNCELRSIANLRITKIKPLSLEAERLKATHCPLL
jgi:hypothetical protein